MIFRAVMTKAAKTELPATSRFSRRIDPEVKTAGLGGIEVIIALDGRCANPCGVKHSLCQLSGLAKM
jgi:hypothetical protein